MEEETYNNSRPQWNLQVNEVNFIPYIDRFTKVVVKVEGSDESLKFYIFKNGLRKDIAFRDKLGHKEAYNLKEFFNRA